jgi:hypothetical protein
MRECAFSVGNQSLLGSCEADSAAMLPWRCAHRFTIFKRWCRGGNVALCRPATGRDSCIMLECLITAEHRRIWSSDNRIRCGGEESQLAAAVVRAACRLACRV